MPRASPPWMGRMPQPGEALVPTPGKATEGSSWAQPSTVSLGAASLQARGDDFDQEVCRWILCKLDGAPSPAPVQLTPALDGGNQHSALELSTELADRSPS